MVTIDHATYDVRPGCSVQTDTPLPEKGTTEARLCALVRSHGSVRLRDMKDLPWYNSADVERAVRELVDSGVFDESYSAEYVVYSFNYDCVTDEWIQQV